ncbi:MAG TPA: DUF6272 family protein [Caldilineaceae bacterium]|nr:DUF6272 family protein [Caldilineaceae bacterium]
MTQTFGDFVAPNHQRQEYLRIGFSPSSLPLQRRWRNNGLSADFLADYLITFFPGEDEKDQQRQSEFKDAVSYVANELLENAMKFSYAPQEHPVSITMQLEQDHIRFYVQNSIACQDVAAFQTFIQRLLSEDPDELYMERLTANTEEEHQGGSGLGFLTMLNHYNAQLAWQFAPADEDPEALTVTTMVNLTV